MFTFGESRFVYFQEDPFAYPAEVEVKDGKVLVFSQFACHGGMSYKSNPAHPEWHPVIHGCFGSSLVQYNVNETVLDSIAIAHHFPEHMPLLGCDQQKNALGILGEKLNKSAKAAMMNPAGVKGSCETHAKVALELTVTIN
jgi:hypothetical protein